MFKVTAISSVLFAAVFSLPGCKNEACERERMDLANKWEEVKLSAARRAAGSVEGGGSAETWNKIEKKADLVYSSFQTEQVTWGPAEKGKGEVEGEFRPLESSASAEIKAFKQLLSEADAAYKGYEERCR